MGFKEENSHFPLNIYLDVFHPEVKNLAFVGIHYLQMFSFSELQANLALRFFFDKENLFESIKGIDQENLLSGNKPYDFHEYLNKVSYLSGNYPDFDLILREDEELYNCIKDGPLLVQMFFLKGENGGILKENSDYIKLINRNLKRK